MSSRKAFSGEDNARLCSVIWLSVANMCFFKILISDNETHFFFLFEMLASFQSGDKKDGIMIFFLYVYI